MSPEALGPVPRSHQAGTRCGVSASCLEVPALVDLALGVSYSVLKLPLLFLPCELTEARSPQMSLARPLRGA